MATPASYPPAPDKIEAAFRDGKVYDPAWTHYGKKGTVVICDRCGASGLTACVGLDNTDICMSCMDILKDPAKRRLDETQRAVAKVSACLPSPGLDPTKSQLLTCSN